MDPFTKAYALAATLPATGPQWWQRAGKTLIQIAELLAEGYFGPQADWRSLTPAQQARAIELITGAFRYLDDLHGWDAPNMSDTEEDLFYGFFVQLGVAGRVYRAQLTVTMER